MPSQSFTEGIGDSIRVRRYAPRAGCLARPEGKPSSMRHVGLLYSVLNPRQCRTPVIGAPARVAIREGGEGCVNGKGKAGRLGAKGIGLSDSGSGGHHSGGGEGEGVGRGAERLVRRFVGA
jgi:hypothetical protein